MEHRMSGNLRVSIQAHTPQRQSFYQDLGPIHVRLVVDIVVDHILVPEAALLQGAITNITARPAIHGLAVDLLDILDGLGRHTCMTMEEEVIDILPLAICQTILATLVAALAVTRLWIMVTVGEDPTNRGQGAVLRLPALLLVGGQDRQPLLDAEDPLAIDERQARCPREDFTHSHYPEPSESEHDGPSRGPPVGHPHSSGRSQHTQIHDEGGPSRRPTISHPHASPRSQPSEIEDDAGVSRHPTVVRVPSGRSHAQHPADSIHHIPPPSHSILSPPQDREAGPSDEDDHPLHDGGHPLPVPSQAPSHRTYSLGRRPSSVRSHRPVTPLPGEFSDAERERERAHRLEDAEMHLQNATHSLIAADEAREHDYRRNEEDRERVFQEGEERRHREARERAELVWRELNDRLAALPLPAPAQPPRAEEHVDEVADTGGDTGGDAGGDGASIHSVMQQAASQHAIDILDTVKAERDEFAREREAAAREREMLMEQAAMERQQMAEQQELRIKALEDELAAVRAELENEKQQRTMMETEQREQESKALQEHDEAVRNQLGDITNLVQDQRDAHEQKRQLMDARWEEKQLRRGDKDQKMNDLEALVRKLSQDMEETRDLALEAKISRERGPSNQLSSFTKTPTNAALDLEDVIKTLQEQNAAQQAMLNELSQSWREDCARYHQETIESVQSTANQQVHFNVQGYLDEFSKALASEVRMLLGEVGKLREERRGLQHEMGYLLCMKSKYGPGGEFDPEWRPAPGAPGGPPLDPPQPPPAEPPAPEIPPPAKPGWRKVTPRAPRTRKAKKEAAPAPPPPPQPQPGPSYVSYGYDSRRSWNTWQRKLLILPLKCYD
ncbi:hypothetical protein H0H81_002780 [Sphagnurus paluster]|uniref:Uncharacterized protein n=1 Tax=Sphagnurus paluster TaxID=117069 RepID=A0A9P7FV89_9AGAR|nr:hypothetical protein H0H81_002780 [Sphagnurus paluster]